MNQDMNRIHRLIRAAQQIPSKAWTFTVVQEAGVYSLECDFCGQPACPIDLGDDLESLLTQTREHRCASQVGAFTRLARNSEEPSGA